MHHPVPVDVMAPPEYFNFAADVVDKWSESDPSLLALQWIDERSERPLNFTYEHFSAQSNKAAKLLKQLGAKPGDRVMVVLNRVPAWWEIATGVLRAGLVLCPCTTLATAKDIEYRLISSGASIFVGNQASLASLAKIRTNCPSLQVVLQADGEPQPGILQYRPTIDAIAPGPLTAHRTKKSDPALIYFTSGTSGPPKMVQHNHISYPLAHSLTGTHWLGLSRGKISWTLAEQGWAKAAWSWFAAWNTGATLFIQDTKKPFSPSEILDVLNTYPITTFCAPPTAYRQLVTKQMHQHCASNAPKALERCVAAGEPLDEGTLEAWRAMTGLQIREGYGQTETILVAGSCEGVHIRPGSMGRSVPGVPLHVIDEDGRPVDVGVEGEIAVLSVDERGHRTPFVCDGYISQEGSLSQKSRARLASDGSVSGQWHLTGDRAYQDTDGYLWYVGRSDDVINSSGYRIGPFEVESALKLHPAVLEAAVIGVKDQSRGEVVKAFIVVESSSVVGQGAEKLKKELQAHCKREAAPYKYPRLIEFVSHEWLPKTISGKIQRAEIRRWEREAARSSRM